MSYIAGASLWLAGTERGAEWLQRPVVITVLHSVVVAIALLLAGILVLAGPLLSWLD
jgi:thiol:disulfide interchange protein